MSDFENELFFIKDNNCCFIIDENIKINNTENLDKILYNLINYKRINFFIFTDFNNVIKKIIKSINFFKLFYIEKNIKIILQTTDYDISQKYNKYFDSICFLPNIINFNVSQNLANILALTFSNFCLTNNEKSPYINKCKRTLTNYFILK